jgi:hypothetical protein
MEHMHWLTQYVTSYYLLKVDFRWQKSLKFSSWYWSTAYTSQHVCCVNEARCPLAHCEAAGSQLFHVSAYCHIYSSLSLSIRSSSRAFFNSFLWLTSSIHPPFVVTIGYHRLPSNLKSHTLTENNIYFKKYTLYFFNSIWSEADMEEIKKCVQIFTRKIWREKISVWRAGHVDYVYLAQDRTQSRVIMNMITNLWVQGCCQDFLPGWGEGEGEPENMLTN